MRAILSAVIIGLGLAVTPISAQERATIVGKWSTAAGKCQRPLSIIVIGPKSLSGEDFGCAFDTVSRSADTVTWQGKCTYGADDPVKETVIARLSGQRLYYRFKSQRGENGPFMRCAK